MEIFIVLIELIRLFNMVKCCWFIFNYVWEIIVKDGFDVFKLRDIVEWVVIIVFIIYNLIGGKLEILKLIIEDLVEKFYFV